LEGGWGGRTPPQQSDYRTLSVCHAPSPKLERCVSDLSVCLRTPKLGPRNFVQSDPVFHVIVQIRCDGRRGCWCESWRFQAGAPVTEAGQAPPAPQPPHTARKPSKAEKQELSLFTCVCDTAKWPTPPAAKRFKKSWIVRYRVPYEHTKDKMPADLVALWECDRALQYRPAKKHRVDPLQRRMWMWVSQRCEFWIRSPSAEHACLLATQLLALGLIVSEVH